MRDSEEFWQWAIGVTILVLILLGAVQAIQMGLWVGKQLGVIH